jgi:large subunit ribosomal protein L5
MKQKLETKQSEENPMRKIRIEKILLSCGATGVELEKSAKLLEMLSGMKAQIIKTNKRIPDFNVRPDLEVGTRVTLRNEAAIALLRRLLGAKDNILVKKQVSDNHFSFGIKEYIEIPGVEYKRDIGTRGLNVTVVFIRSGIRVRRKKVNSGKVPAKQNVSKEEILKFMKENFKTEFTGK